MSAVSAFERVTYTLPRRGDARRCATCRCSVAPGEFVVARAACRRGGKSTLLRAAAGLVPHFHGGTFAGRVVVGGLDTREHGPGDARARSPARCSRTPRRRS